MEVIVGKTAGFCYGVKRAVESAENDVVNSKEKVYCLGEIVHNRQVVNNLKKKSKGTETGEIVSRVINRIEKWAII